MTHIWNVECFVNGFWTRLAGVKAKTKAAALARARDKYGKDQRYRVTPMRK